MKTIYSFHVSELTLRLQRIKSVHIGEVQKYKLLVMSLIMLKKSI